MSNLSTCIVRHWVHSHEEDTEDVRVYRPADYRFPPSRGRIGFAFRGGGEVIYYGIAPADGPRPLPGRWHIEGPDRVTVELEGGSPGPLALHVVSCDEQMLKVRRS